MKGGYKTFSITIAKSGQASTAFETGNAQRGSWKLPAAIDAANFGAQISIDGTNYTAAETPFAGAANGTYALPAAALSARYCRIYASAAQNTAARTLTVVLKTDVPG